MNTRPAIDDSPSPAALSASFNSDNSCFAVALESGFQIYKSAQCEIDKVRDFGGGIGYAEMLDTTKYVALVGGGRQPKFPQNKLVIWDDAKQIVLLTLEVKTPIQRIRWTRSYIAIVMLNSVRLYKFSLPPQLVGEFETANNPFGLCCLGKRLLVFPGRTPGQLKTVELAAKNVSIIPAHISPLRAIELSQDEEVLATASETGTLIRIWSTRNFTRVGEFRRGVDPATVFDIAVNPSSTMVAVTSDKSTLHLFDLQGPNQASHALPERGSTPQMDQDQDGSAQQRNKWGILSKIPIMPRIFTDTYSSTCVHFEIGDEPSMFQGRNSSLTWNAPIPGVPGGRPPKGLIGWLNNDSLLIVGAGQDARWEKLSVGHTEDGKRVCWREGWRRYLE